MSTGTERAKKPADGCSKTVVSFVIIESDDGQNRLRPACFLQWAPQFGPASAAPKPTCQTKALPVLALNVEHTYFAESLTCMSRAALAPAPHQIFHYRVTLTQS